MLFSVLYYVYFVCCFGGVFVCVLFVFLLLLFACVVVVVVVVLLFCWCVPCVVVFACLLLFCSLCFLNLSTNTKRKKMKIIRQTTCMCIYILPCESCEIAPSIQLSADQTLSCKFVWFCVLCVCCCVFVICNNVFLLFVVGLLCFVLCVFVFCVFYFLCFLLLCVFVVMFDFVVVFVRSVFLIFQQTQNAKT